jgi:D-aspartate ligase
VAAAASASPAPTAKACVMGDMDLLRPLALAEIPCAVVSRPGVPSLYSRYALSRLAWDDYSGDTERLLDALVTFGTAQPEPPVLFYQEDGQTLLISRHRERLAKAFRFVVADSDLVEDLLDKARFQTLAARHELPVPTARRFDPAKIEPAHLGLRFPLILKPLTRLDRWNDALGSRKALCAENLETLRALWPQLSALGLELLAQEFVHGSEARIESYHCYVDQQGRIAGEFTGRKIRTYPLRFGHTTALEITDAADVRGQGRNIVERLSLSGVAKLDFKRDMQGNLRLLEINPRFTPWPSSRRARRREYSGAGLCRSNRIAAAGAGAPEIRLALVPPVEGFSRRPRSRRAAPRMGALDDRLPSEIDAVLRRSAAVFARDAVSARWRGPQARGDRSVAPGQAFRFLTADRV